MCFDSGAASSPTRVVPIGKVVDLLELAPYAEELVELYRERMRSGSRFPPVSVLPLFGKYVLADGHKRLAAYRGLRESQDAGLLVEVWSTRRFLLDQLAQARRNAGKNREILRLMVANPRESARLVASTLSHWRRVARALFRRVRVKTRSRPAAE